MLKRTIWMGVAALGLMVGGMAQASSFALLVGVSDYTDGIGITDLNGPRNDVSLLSLALSTRADFDVAVLADGIDGAARPTRTAILGALDDLARRVAPGDFVYIHLSGHGTQQPDDDGDETDGLDEVFLPADTGRAVSGSREIPNAIRDEELGARVAALRARGADVWFVLDSCHSGSGLRSSAPDMATRFVDPALLGIDVQTSAPADPNAAPMDGPGDDDLPGRYLAFYAAQSSELAREIEIDPNAASGNGWYGLFSSRLAARLTQENTGTYRQLFQAVLSDMNSADIPGAARLQTPLWEGNLIDATVLGGSGTIGLRQYAVAGDQMSAGLLHGIGQGALVSLVADATDGPEEQLGMAQVISATAQSARLAPVDDSCVAQAETLCAVSGVLPDQARFARVRVRPIDLTLRLGTPVELQTGQELAMDHPLYTALVAAVANANEGDTARIELTPTGSDISVGLYDGALWFGPKVAEGDSPVGLAWHPDEAELEPLLVRIFKAERVARMLDSVGSGGSILFGNPVAVNIKMNDTDMQNRPRDANTLSALQDECKAALTSARPRQMPRVEVLNQCDQLSIEAQGTFQGPARDVNRVYIDSQFCVETAYARVEGVTIPAKVGRALTICADCPSGDGIAQKAGHERLFMVVTEARENAEALDLRGVLDTCGPEIRTRSRSSAASFLEEMGKRTGLRGNLGEVGVANLWVERFDWQILPRREALAREGLPHD